MLKFCEVLKNQRYRPILCVLAKTSIELKQAML